MTTLTERLRELERDHKDAIVCPIDDAVLLAQELHALLVECGEASSGLLYQRREFEQSCGNYEEAYYKLAKYADWRPLKTVFTKLQQAGIV